MQPIDERPKLPHYDPDYCGKVAKWAASICLGIVIIELLILLFVDPSNGQCPRWNIYHKNGAATSLWVVAGVLTAAPTICISYVALRWEQKFSREMYDSIAYKRRKFPNFGFGVTSKPDNPQNLNFDQIFLLNANRLFLEVCIGWGLFCTAPLWMMLTNCINIPRYLGS